MSNGAKIRPNEHLITCVDESEDRIFRKSWPLPLGSEQGEVDNDRLVIDNDCSDTDAVGEFGLIHAVLSGAIITLQRIRMDVRSQRWEKWGGCKRTLGRMYMGVLLVE